jgi:hypothetical protein
MMNSFYLEVCSYVVAIALWTYLHNRFGRQISGDILMGTVMGFFLEFSTEPVSNYRFALTIYKDLPLIIPFDWGLMFALTALASDKLYARFFGNKAKPDGRIFILDLMIGTMIGFPAETLGAHLGAWTYNIDALGWSLGQVPFFHMPWEAAISYALIMLIGPTFVRSWRLEAKVAVAA